MENTRLNQDLHIHTTFSKDDSAVAEEQTIALIAQISHAKIVGISDHLESLEGDLFDLYKKTVHSYGLKIGTEVDGSVSINRALEVDPDYYIYHCYNNTANYKGAERLLQTGKPVIIAHPLFLGTDAEKIPEGCLIEINNRYIWRSNWKEKLPAFVKHFEFVFSSDAHQPHWLNQNIARFVATELCIQEKLIF